jgi:hypothetical protein
VTVIGLTDEKWGEIACVIVVADQEPDGLYLQAGAARPVLRDGPDVMQLARGSEQSAVRLVAFADCCVRVGSMLAVIDTRPMDGECHCG